MSDDLRARGHEAHILDLPRPRFSLAGLGNAFLAGRTAYRVWQLGKSFEILHCQQLHPQSLAAVVVARILGKGVVITIHGRSPRPAGVRGLVFSVVERLTVHLPHRVVLVAHSLREPVRYGVVIHNGVPVDEVRQHAKAGASIRRELGLRNAFVLLFMGRISSDKGFLVLLDVMAKLHETDSPAVRLLAVGPVEPSLMNEVSMRTGSLGGIVLLTGEQSD